MSASCVFPALDTLLLIDDLAVDRDAVFWGVVTITTTKAKKDAVATLAEETG